MSLIDAGLAILRDKLAVEAADAAAEQRRDQEDADAWREWEEEREREAALRRGGERLGPEYVAACAAFRERVSPLGMARLYYPRATAPTVVVAAPEPAPFTFRRTGGFGPAWKTNARVGT